MKARRDGGEASSAAPADSAWRRFATSAGPSGRRRVPFGVPKAGALVLLAAAALAGCGADGAARPDDSGRIQACRAGDQRVPSESACLQDDAACYALADGDWCTGERGNTCPAGSSALPDGAACPAGARCFRVGESLECVI